METRPRNPIRSFTPVLLAASAAAIAAVTYYLNMKDLTAVPNPEPWGQLGDFFGGLLGPTFNLISMYLLIKTIQLQQFQIADARKANEDISENALAEHKLNLKQSFEQTLFTWLHSYRQIVSEVSAPRSSGRLALTQLFDDWFVEARIVEGAEVTLSPHLRSVTADYKEADQQALEIYESRLLYLYELLYAANAFQFDTLFRTLYRLIKWIDKAAIDDSEKFEYVGIVRSQVSNIEMHYLFLNGLTYRGEKFKDLIEKYALFSNFDAHKLLFLGVRRLHNISGTGYAKTAFNSDKARAALGLQK